MFAPLKRGLRCVCPRSKFVTSGSRARARKCWSSDCFLAAHFGDDAGLSIFRTSGLNTTNVGFSRDVSLHSATGMRKLAGQWVAQQFPCRSFTCEQLTAQGSPVRTHETLPRQFSRWSWEKHIKYLI